MNDEKRNELLTAAHYSKHDSTLQTREENGERIIEGYAAKYETETNIGPFMESISRGAFDNVLENDVRALINHDPSLVLGRTSAGTLELTSDDVGLKYRVKLGNQQYATDYMSLFKGVISRNLRLRLRLRIRPGARIGARGKLMRWLSYWTFHQSLIQRIKKLLW